MSNFVKRCRKCNHIGIYSKDYNIHKDCNGELKIVNLTCDELITISSVSDDNDFLQAMIDLKEKDIIEYNLKMSQFKTQLEQQQRTSIKSDNSVKCPKCGSTSIATGARGVNFYFGVWGASKKVNRCANCGHIWKP